MMLGSSGCFPDVGCALEVSETLGRRGLKSCADSLVVICFPTKTEPDYDHVVSVDGSSSE